MRTDVHEISYADMNPAMRAVITYEQNASFDVADPRPIYSELMSKYPVVKWEGGVAFFQTQDILAAGRHPDVISVNPYTGLSMGMGSRDPLIPLHLYGEKHVRYRKLLTPLLTANRLEPWADRVCELADELIDSFIHAGQAELFSQFADPLPTKIFLRVFGLPREDLPFLVAMKDSIIKASGETLEDREEQSLRAGDRLREHLAKRLAQKQNDGPSDDLIGHFLTFEIDGHRLTDDEIVNIMHLFTIAGLDTVSSSLSLQFAWLATHPEKRAELVGDPSLWPTAIEEMMRTQSPVPHGGLRWAADDLEINDVEVKKGQMIFLAWATGNVDPAVFEDPLTVDVHRKPNRHMSFAVGLHRCLGSHLARLEMHMAQRRFHERIPDYAVVPDKTIVYRSTPGVRQAPVIPVVFPRP
ncbi:MAG: cytochrome P450 [Mycobacterium sp.]